MFGFLRRGSSSTEDQNEKSHGLETSQSPPWATPTTTSSAAERTTTITTTWSNSTTSTTESWSPSGTGGAGAGGGAVEAYGEEVDGLKVDDDLSDVNLDDQENKMESPTGQQRRRVLSNLISNERREKMRQRFQTVGNKISKLNLGKLINEMENDQKLADNLESLNEEMQEEIERKEIQRISEEACLQTIVEHLEDFLKRRPDATYEQWIEDLHPENAHDGKLITDIDDFKEIDLRFYVEESDHRILWNKYFHDVPLRLVAARTCKWGGKINNDSNNNKNHDPDSHNNNPPTVDFLDTTTSLSVREMKGLLPQHHTHDDGGGGAIFFPEIEVGDENDGGQKKDETDLISF